MKENKNRNVKRGEIYLYNFTETSKTGETEIQKKPVIVVQSDELNAYLQTTAVCAISAYFKQPYSPAHLVIKGNFGLVRKSMIQTEAIFTIQQSSLDHYVGKVDDPVILGHLDMVLKKTLGLWKEKPRKNRGEIRCLCSKCLKDYLTDPDFIVKRADPLSDKREKCDKCSSMGWDYIIYRKSDGKRNG